MSKFKFIAAIAIVVGLCVGGLLFMAYRADAYAAGILEQQGATIGSINNFIDKTNAEFKTKIPRIPDIDKTVKKHPNNELVKGYQFLTNPVKFFAEHPNNELTKAAELAVSPEQFIKNHPNNELAKALQAFTKPNDFIRDHPNNDLGKAMHFIKDPGDFAKKHPNNEITKLYEVQKDIVNAPKKALDEVERGIKKLGKAFRL